MPVSSFSPPNLPAGWVRFGDSYINLNMVPRVDFSTVAGVRVAQVHYQTNACDTTSSPDQVANVEATLAANSADLTATPADIIP